MTDIQGKKFNNFTFFGDYLANIQELPQVEQDEIILAIVYYATLQKKPQFSQPYLQTIFNCVKFSLDKSISAGKRGQGRKKKAKIQNTDFSSSIEIKSKSNKNQNEIKSKSNQNQIKIKLKSNAKQQEQEQELELKKYMYVQPQAVGTHAKCGRKNERLEFEFYLWCFNKLFEREFTATEGRLRFYKQRRKKFELLDIITSLQVMAGEPFYRGEGQTDRDNPWRTSPDFHLRKDENIAKFLELENASGEREYIKGRLPTLKKQFMANYQVKNRKENKNG